MSQWFFNNGLKVDTAAGTLLTILFNLRGEDLLKTGITATIGALVSFGVSLLLRWLTGKRKR